MGLCRARRLRARIYARRPIRRSACRELIGDKAKSQIYCDVLKLGEQIEETDPKDKKKADELYQQVDELATKLGPEYIALMKELQDMDPDSEDGKEIGSTLEALDKLCSK